MSFDSLMFDKANVWREVVNTVPDSIGGYTSTLVLIHSNIPVNLQYMTGREQVIYGKNNVSADHKIYCRADYDLSTDDYFEINGLFYEVEYIDNSIHLYHHLEILTNRVEAPEHFIPRSSSSNSSSYSSSSSSSSYIQNWSSSSTSYIENWSSSSTSYVELWSSSSSSYIENWSSSSNSSSSSSSSSSLYDYEVIGTLTPDATGYYSVNGTFLDQPAYERVGGGYWLWHDNSTYITSGWIISVNKGDSGNLWAQDMDTTIIYNNYTPLDVTGTASVTKA